MGILRDNMYRCFPLSVKQEAKWSIRSCTHTETVREYYLNLLIVQTPTLSLNLQGNDPNLGVDGFGVQSFGFRV